jgi:hypothetical protein
MVPSTHHLAFRFSYTFDPVMTLAVMSEEFFPYALIKIGT